MTSKLRDNAYKGVWDECDLEYLFSRLGEEVAELRMSCEAAKADFDTDVGIHLKRNDIHRIAREAADVANFALMIQDRCGGTKAR